MFDVQHMKILFILLCISFNAFCALTPVSYIKDGEIKTIFPKSYQGGYAYNLEAKKIIYTATHNWPPYVDESLCNKGWLYQLTVKFLLEQGYGVVIHFYPWSRALRETELGRVSLLFPKYDIDQSDQSLAISGQLLMESLELSRPLPGGDLSFITLKDTAIKFNGFNFLKNYVLGVGRGYKNSKDVDLFLMNSDVVTITANNDHQLLKLLVNKRVDVIIADFNLIKATANKYRYIDEDNSNLSNSITALEPPIESKELYYAVSKANPISDALLRKLNTSISAMTDNNLIEKFITDNSLSCN